MRRVANWLANPRTQVWFNGLCMVMWFLMVPVTLFVPALRTAILYVALMSVWANFATHLGGWISSLVNARAERVEANTEQALHFTRIEQAEDRLGARLDEMNQKIERISRDHGSQLAQVLDACHQSPLPSPAKPDGALAPPETDAA